MSDWSCFLIADCVNEWKGESAIELATCWLSSYLVDRQPTDYHHM